MSRDENRPDQPGLWDENVEQNPARQSCRRQQPSPQTTPDTAPPPPPRAPVEADRLWTVNEVAAFLGVPKKTIYAWRTTGKGPKGFRVGKHLRWHPRTVFEWSLKLEREQ
ncbi:helix-turn-helix transcriptional regulator [Nocardioides sp. SYSU DS0651]|uniref:helix-turn-helix transcriptional regulator n=1 Tax=Nocardioides sp. SYSU DS0651 TaxID=3415955 RepID=UPI003F4BE898